MEGQSIYHITAKKLQQKIVWSFRNSEFKGLPETSALKRDTLIPGND